ncbi:hypothetical protein EV360DRAFT_68368 [Lentinula raphanica]|nr:hypothetical protein EV360DRAFT_68368 [Lentinula raphanica]
MTRSTARVLAVLFLGGAISSGVLAAPTLISSQSTSSIQSRNGAQTPQCPSSCARLGSLSGSGPTSKVPTHQRRGVYANFVSRRTDGDDLITVTSSERKENGDSDASVSVLEGRADRRGSDASWEDLGSGLVDEPNSASAEPKHLSQESGLKSQPAPQTENGEQLSEVSGHSKQDHIQQLRSLDHMRDTLGNLEKEDTAVIESRIFCIKTCIIKDPGTAADIRKQGEEILHLLNAEIKRRKGRVQSEVQKGSTGTEQLGQTYLLTAISVEHGVNGEMRRLLWILSAGFPLLPVTLEQAVIRFFTCWKRRYLPSGAERRGYDSEGGYEDSCDLEHLGLGERFFLPNASYESFSPPQSWSLTATNALQFILRKCPTLTVRHLFANNYPLRKSSDQCYHDSFNHSSIGSLASRRSHLVRRHFRSYFDAELQSDLERSSDDATGSQLMCQTVRIVVWWQWLVPGCSSARTSWTPFVAARDGSSDGVTSGKNSAERKENAAGGTNDCIPVIDLKDPADDGGRKDLEDIKFLMKYMPPSKASDEELKDGMMERIQGYLLDRYKGVSPDVETEAKELYAKLEEENNSRREARERASRASRGAEVGLRQDDTTKP